MAFVDTAETGRFGYDFIPAEFLPAGKDEYWQRNLQSAGRSFRRLRPEERAALIAGNNRCPNWDDFLVGDPFDPTLITDSRFYGLVRIGSLRPVLLRHHDFRLPAGIRDSTVISCDIGDDAAIADCGYLSHYVVGDRCILYRIDEMQTTNHAKFGNGALKDGEEEDVRVWIDVMNEAGGRSILPFRDMIPADAYLWAAFRDDAALASALLRITQAEYGGARGTYGRVGSHAVIKSCRIIKDADIGEWAYVKGANKLKNVTVLSSKEEPSQIGEGVELVNGIVGYGCSAFYGVKAVRFVLGRNSSLKYGARLIHSVLGDNSTVSCCEILNNLVFPVHEQHHNNSFLIASLIQGMSNMAAGATLGSNHNSRANDGEIRAGRGFWPGLSVTLKHSSRFAGFVLVTKGRYPHELDIPLPFSLVADNERLGRLEVMPAYFWMHNMYALERNAWKSLARDRRKAKVQRIHADYLAPDTAGEIMHSLTLLETWAAKAGIALNPEERRPLETTGAGTPPLEGGRRQAVILKPGPAYAAYREMLFCYCLGTLARYLLEEEGLSFAEFVSRMDAGDSARISEPWENLGGQFAPAFRVDELRSAIGRGEIDSWQDIHRAYDRMADCYREDSARHAWNAFRFLSALPEGAPHPLADRERFRQELRTLAGLKREIAERVSASRAKDFASPLRLSTFRNPEEMATVLGRPADNAFVKLFAERTEEEIRGIGELGNR